MGGATQGGENGDVPINSCIAFLNSVDKSKEMATKLQSEPVREWVQEWLHKNGNGSGVRAYTLEHLDARSNVTARDAAKQKLAEASEDSPYGILNVGIFGEGTDSPSLNAVAFLEARKSPIDVIQAVGRAMRTAPDKEVGYIICPILIPLDTDPESWLSVSNAAEGWQELGQILLALRAHDQRIEDELSKLLYLYLPSEPEVVRAVVAVAREQGKRISYWEHVGPPGSAEEALERVGTQKSEPSEEFHRFDAAPVEYEDIEPTIILSVKPLPQKQNTPPSQEPPQISDSEDLSENFELRMDTVVRDKPGPDGARGKVNRRKTKEKAGKMVNNDVGRHVTPPSKKRSPSRKRRSREEIVKHAGQQMILLSGLGEHGDAVKMNLLSKSGLSANHVVRDLNILETSITEAAFHLRSDELTDALNRHFGLDLLKPDGKKSADGCTIAALLMMNAAMLHQRIGAGRWMSGISDLSTIKNDVGVVYKITREWERIMRIDFLPIFKPAVDSIDAIQETGKTSGLERALRHITAEAERIAETYADMGADHAGPLFNRVIGNQASDGAYFTRPVAAGIAARLTLDACGKQDWTDPNVWRRHKTVDLACGSGTLLMAMLTDMKRRARELGADENSIAQLQKIAVEDVIKGMDINPVSLQLAAAQLTTGNSDVRYRKMGLHLMPYGPTQYDPSRVSAGTLELLGQKAIVRREGELDIPDNAIGSQSIWEHGNDVELEDAVDDAKDARIVIMNAPFTRRAKMGEKFPKGTQRQLHARIDVMKANLVRSDRELDDFMDKNTLRPLFVALGEKVVQGHSQGVMTMISPTIALTGTSGRNERRILAERFHMHTIVTCHHPRNINLSQQTAINESIVVMRRHSGPKPPTRFINLDRIPTDESESEDLHRCLTECEEGQIKNGWGEVSFWPANRIAVGDWSAAMWRSPELARAGTYFANHEDLKTLAEYGVSARRTSDEILRTCIRAEGNIPGSLQILESAGQEGQYRIESQPEGCWITKTPDEERRQANGGTYPEIDRILRKSGHLLVPFRQDNVAARLTAVASNEKHVGTGWMPVTNLSPDEAKAIAVFMNSTAGRLQLMRNTGMKLTYPTYPPAAYANIKIPSIKNNHIRGILVECWERTKDIDVPQFRDGECEVRRLWDEAVADAMGWDKGELERLRLLLHQEPHVRGLGYGQYADEVEE